MSKYSIKDITIINKSKESYNVLKLENKDVKQILYGCKNKEFKDNENFAELCFDNPNFEITPKKKKNKLKIDILQKDTKYFITLKNQTIYYLKTDKIIMND